MPTYEYVCKECGHTFEELESITAKPLTVCPNCGKPALKRLMAAGAGTIFKGSGFYLTDYKKSGRESAAQEKKKPEKKSEKTPEKKSEATSDTKPASDSSAPKPEK
ncbi:MAG TPA: zinc ribbon domain-containing protein [Bacteroidota bacterium]|nr:zinc ribbon domain-containing protein [Bacteroidota bacterium]